MLAERFKVGIESAIKASLMLSVLFSLIHTLMYVPDSFRDAVSRAFVILVFLLAALLIVAICITFFLIPLIKIMEHFDCLNDYILHLSSLVVAIIVGGLVIGFEMKYIYLPVVYSLFSTFTFLHSYHKFLKIKGEAINKLT